MKGTVIITGANGGIGQAITRKLSREGFRVIMACRNIPATKPLYDQIRTENGCNHIELLPLDLASLKSVCNFAQLMNCRKEPIHALINNAGTMPGSFSPTEDKLELATQVNYVAPWLLTRLLLPLLSASGTGIVVNTCSCTYRLGKITPSFLQPCPETFHRFKTYGSSKLALLLFTQELSKYTANQEVRAYAVDPGVVDTGILSMHQWYDSLTNVLFRPFTRKPEKGAATQCWLTQHAHPHNIPEGYYRDCKTVHLPEKFCHHPQQEHLWHSTEIFLEKYIR